MTQPQIDNRSGLVKAKEYWPLIMALVIIVSTWAAIGLCLDALEIKADRNERQIELVEDTVSSTFADMRVMMMKIQTDVGYIRIELDKHID